MSGIKLRRVLLLALVVALAAVVPALAATPRNTTVTVLGGSTYKINRFAGDTMRFSKDSYTIRSGGTLTIRNRTGELHTLSVVRRSRLPRTTRQIEACFERGICGPLAGAHQFPEGEELLPPARPVVDPDGKGFNQAGDSVAFSGGRTRIKVSAKPRSTLRFMCIIHPWMQSKIRVK